MAKIKLSIATTDFPRLVAASELSDVNVGKTKTFLNELIVEVSFKSASQLFKLGRYFDKVSPELPIETKQAKPKK